MSWTSFFRKRGTWHTNEEAFKPRGRDIYANQIFFQVAVGSRRDAVAAANRFAAMEQGSSFQIKELPIKESERVRLGMRPESQRKWAVVVLYRRLLEANSLRPAGDSIHVETYENESPDNLVRLVNEQIAARETVDIQLSFDSHKGVWVADVSFPYSLKLERVL